MLLEVTIILFGRVNEIVLPKENKLDRVETDRCEVSLTFRSDLTIEKEYRQCYVAFNRESLYSTGSC